MHVLRPVVGLITIGQAPRVDVVPDMAEILGPGVEIREAGALDGLDRAEIASLAPGAADEILVTRLADASSVFVAKRHVTPRVQAKLAELERAGVTLTALLCTGAFGHLAASRPLIQPHQVLLGVLRGMSWPGRLGILTPSVPHVPQTEARWRADGFDPVVVPLSPYEEDDSAALVRAADALRAAATGLVVMDCIGFRRKTRHELQGLTGAPVLLANLLVARVIAEVCGI
jgi:protein AroM